MVPTCRVLKGGEKRLSCCRASRLDRLGARLARQQDSRFSPPFSTLQVGTIQGGAAR
jgi:hypothetical protein